MFGEDYILRVYIKKMRGEQLFRVEKWLKKPMLCPALKDNIDLHVVGAMKNYSLGVNQIVTCLQSTLVKYYLLCYQYELD